MADATAAVAPADPFELAYNELAQEILAHNQQVQRGRTMPEMVQAYQKPAIQYASSANTGLGDAIAQALGSPAAGRFTTGAQQAAKGVVDTAYGMTGIPLAADAGENMGRAVEEGNPLRGLMSAGELGLAAAPFVGPASRLMFSTIPRAMASGAAYGLVPGLAAGTLFPDSADAAEPAKPESASPSTLQQLYSQREELMRQRSEAIQRREAEAKTGRGPNYQKADSDVNKVDAQLGGLTQMISNEERKSSPEYQLEVQKKKAEADEAERLKRANTSIKELYPPIMPFLPVFAGMVAGGLGAKIKGSYNRAFNEEMQGLSARWKSALDRAGNTSVGSPARTRAVKEAENLGEEFAAMKKSGPGGTWPALAAGAAAGEMAQLGPLAVDYARAVPGSPLYDKTVGAMTDIPAMAGRVFNGILAGGLPAEIGAKWADSRSLKSFPGYGAKTRAFSDETSPPSGGGTGEPSQGPSQQSQWSSSRQPPPANPGSAPQPPGQGQGPPPSTPSTSKSSSSSDEPLPLGVKKSEAGYHGPDGRFLPHSIFKGKTSAADNPLKQFIG